MKTMALALIVLLFQGLHALNLEISVKECAGVGSSGYPIRTVVPLKAGSYQNTSSFRLTDASGTVIPAQFEVLSRQYLGDQSITNIAVIYKPVVSAFTGTGTGISKYYLKDDGTSDSTGNGLTVTEGADIITVVTGPSLKFTVKKTGFNVIDQLWYDPNSGSDFSSANLVIKSNAKSGGQFIGRLAGDLQYDADRTDLKAEIEESGPVEAIIRIEAVTKYNSPSDHLHGWAVRIYAYAGQSILKVDYQLQNSAKNKKYAWPLYFHALNLNLDLNLSGTLNIKTGLGNGSVDSRALGNGVCLAQRKDNLFNVYGVDGAGDTTTVLATGSRPEGFLDVDNGTVGVTVQTRNFWRMWPNGLKIDASQRLSVQLFPEWSCQINAAVSNPVFNTTHLYWLADMQHVYKEVVLNFHRNLTNSQLINFAKTVDYHPVASLPVAYVGQAGSSLDLAGLIPFSTKLAGADTRLPVEPGPENLGWYYFLLNGRRTGTTTTGGFPQGGGQFWATENPSDWFTSERWAIGEMNIRPQWMAQYNFKTDYPLLYLGTNLNGSAGPRFDPSSWRNEENGADMMDSVCLAGTGGGGLFPIGYSTVIDNSHYWHYHIKDSYWITGNPWQRDYYKFIVEFRKNFAATNGTMSRGGGHSLADALNAFNITGDTIMARMLNENMVNNRKGVRPQYGDYNTLCCGQFGTAPWEMGFGARPVIDYLEQVEDGSPQAWAEGFQLLSAYMSWNLNYGNFGYRAYSPERQNSYLGSSSLLDPQAWYYWHTGKGRFLDQAMVYITTGITVANGVGGAPGNKPMNGDGSSPWKGDYAGRWMQFVRENKKSDSTPPPAVSDLTLTRIGKQCVVRWTVPVDAKRQHIVWGNKPICAEATDDNRFLNWWAANVIGRLVGVAAGASDQVVFAVPDTGLLFAAVFTFDSSGNMSGISNLGKSDATLPGAPSGLTATILSAQKVKLTWNASLDAESGIRAYTVYRNGVLVATVETRSWTDETLAASTGYDYEVAAISGSLTESVKSPVHVVTPIDTVAPAVESVSSTSASFEFTLVFSEKLDPVSAQAKAFYAINKGQQVLGAVLQPDQKSVVVTCDALWFDTTYSVTLNGIKDLAATPNTVSNLTVSFIHREPLSLTNVNPSKYLWDVFTENVDCFVDQSTKMSSLPVKYQGLPLLRTGSMQDKDYASPVAFTSNRPLMVYVMMDASQKPPLWLTSRFTANGDSIPCLTADYAGSTVVWEAPFPVGRDSIPNGGMTVKYSNYFVVVRPLDTAVISIEGGSSTEYADGLTAHPNPFNPQISIVVKAGSRSPSVSLSPIVKVYNMQGRLVVNLRPARIFQAAHSGRYEYIWNAAGYASGSYLMTVRVNGKNWHKSMALLK